MKKILAIVLVLAMALSLAACGGDTSSSAPAGGSSAAGDSSTAAQSITYWSMWTSEEPQGKVIAEAAAAFEAETGIHVNIEWKGRDITTVLAAALDGGESIDVFDDDFQRVSTQFSSYCYDLEDMAAAAGYEDFAVAALPTAVRRWAGSLVCIPYQPYTSGVFFTMSSFEAAGLVDEEGNAIVPTTWDEFLTTCKALKDAGYTALAQDDAYTMYTYGFLLARLIGQEAVSTLTKEGGWAENEAAKQAAQAIVDLKENGYLSSTSPDAYPAGENEIGFGTASMVINASWVPSEITNNTDCDETWGFFNFPDMGGTDPATVANIGAQAMAVNKNSANAQAAFDFIMFITSGEWGQTMALETSSIPADTRNTEWPEMIAGVRDGFNAQTDVYDWNMGLNDNADIKESLTAYLAQLFEGTMTAQEFVDSMDALY